MACLAITGALFSSAGLAQSKSKPAPSGYEATDISLSRNQNGRVTKVMQPGRDSGTTQGNVVNFDTPGAVPSKRYPTPNLNNSRVTTVRRGGSVQ